MYACFHSAEMFTTVYKSINESQKKDMFCYVNEKSTDDRVITLLELGANPFWQDETGTTAIVKAALSDIEPRKKLRTLQAWQTTEVIFGCEKTKTRIRP